MAEKGKLHIRAGVVDITPTGRVPLGCNDHTYSSGVEADSRLEANILLIGEGSEQVAIVTLDALYVGDSLHSGIFSAINEFFDDERVIITASHTHSATMFDESKPGLGKTNSMETERVSSLVSQEILKLFQSNPTECRVEFGQNQHDCSVSRRRKRFLVFERNQWGIPLRFPKVIMGPNYSAKIDKKIRRIIFKDLDGRSVAEIWSVALHPTSFPTPGILSADYIGVVRKGIRKQKNKLSMPVLFLQGFSGEIRAKTPPTGLVSNLIRGKQFGKFTYKEYAAWSNLLAKKVLNTETSPLPSTDIVCRSVSVSSKDFIFGATGPRNGLCHLLSIGTIGLVTLPTEAVSYYQSLLEKEFAKKLEHVFGVGCAGHVWGYSPNQKMLREGGYEVSGFLNSFGAEAVNPNIEENIKGIFRHLANSDHI